MNEFNFKSNLNDKFDNEMLKTFKSPEIKDIDKLLNDKKTVQYFYDKWSIHKNYEETIKDVFLLIDDNYKFTTYQEMLNISFFIGMQLEKIIKNLHVSEIKSKKPNTSKSDNIGDVIANAIANIFGDKAMVMNLNTGKTFNEDIFNKKSNYIYSLTTRLHITDKATENNLTVTNNMENVLNEIIDKEGYDNIKDKRIFATGTDDVVSEIIPIYKNSKCESVEFKVLN